MNLELIIAGLALFITIVVNIVAVSYFAGILKANQEHQKETLQLLKEDFREHFVRLEQKQDKHNNLIERQFKTESNIDVLFEKVDVANHRIEDLENAWV